MLINSARFLSGRIEYRASLNWLFERAYRIALGLIEKQIGYDLEKFGVSTITTCLLLSRKEYAELGFELIVDWRVVSTEQRASNTYPVLII